MNRKALAIILTVLSAAGAIAWPWMLAIKALAFALIFVWGGLFVGIYTVVLSIVGSQFSGSKLVGIYAVMSVAWGGGALLGPAAVGFNRLRAARRIYDFQKEPYLKIKSLAWIFLIGGCVRLVAAEGTETPPIPTQIVNADISGVGQAVLSGGGPWRSRQSALDGDISFMQREAIVPQKWYWGWGARSDVFAFHNDGTFPISHLQDYAAQFSLEYFIDGEVVASLQAFPGFYFESTPEANSWDIPFEIVSGIPISQAWSGVIGMEYARFDYIPIPIAGFSWKINPQWRADILYPDPELAYKINDRWETSLKGELLGNGYRVDDIPDKTHVEYYEYRIGAHAQWMFTPGFKLQGGAGYEMGRQFNFLPTPSRFNTTQWAPFVHLGLEWSH